MTTDLPERIAAEITPFGGLLRCEVCGSSRPIGHGVAAYLDTGWPTCHGLTMCWWTQRQIDAGEMP